jgi:hypothetical protein
VSHRAAGYGTAAAQNAALGVDARISIAASGTGQVGTSRTFTVTVEKNDGSGWAPADGVAVNGMLTSGSVGAITGGTCDGTEPDTDGSGHCTIIVSSGATGLSTVDATATVSVEGVVGPVSKTVSTSGSGATATWVDARITVATSDAGTGLVSSPHTFMVIVEKNDGTGWSAVSGIAVDATEAGDGGITGGTCSNTVGDTASDGTCTIIVNSSVTGMSTVNATATVVVGGVNIDVSTSGYGAHDIDNVATWAGPPPP